MRAASTVAGNLIFLVIGTTCRIRNVMIGQSAKLGLNEHWPKKKSRRHRDEKSSFISAWSFCPLVGVERTLRSTDAKSADEPSGHRLDRDTAEGDGVRSKISSSSSASRAQEAVMVSDEWIGILSISYRGRWYGQMPSSPGHMKTCCIPDPGY